jgi:hypothetical protein
MDKLRLEDTSNRLLILYSTFVRDSLYRSDNYCLTCHKDDYKKCNCSFKCAVCDTITTVPVEVVFETNPLLQFKYPVDSKSFTEEELKTFTYLWKIEVGKRAEFNTKKEKYDKDYCLFIEYKKLHLCSRHYRFRAFFDWSIGKLMCYMPNKYICWYTNPDLPKKHIKRNHELFFGRGNTTPHYDTTVENSIEIDGSQISSYTRFELSIWTPYTHPITTVYSEDRKASQVYVEQIQCQNMRTGVIRTFPNIAKDIRFEKGYINPSVYLLFPPKVRSKLRPYIHQYPWVGRDIPSLLTLCLHYFIALDPPRSLLETLPEDLQVAYDRLANAVQSPW